jgi:flagellar biosynthesis/type III secretory pathway chaperone
LASLIEDLLNVLDEEVSQHKRLLEIAKSKTEVIIRDDITGLHAITDNEQDIVGGIMRLEKSREEIVNDIAIVINKDANELTISKIAELLPDNQDGKHRLRELQLELVSIITQLQKINNMNKDLLSEAAQMVDYTINYIQSCNQGPETAGYTKQTIYGETKPRSSFDAKQ